MIMRWFTSIQVFLAWLIGFALALIVVMLWHELLMVFIINTLQWGEHIVRLIRIVYYCVAGLALVAYFTFSKSYLSQSSKKGLMLRSSLEIIGIQLLIIALSQTGLTLYEFFPADWPGITLIAVEGLAGAGMLFFARRKKEHQAAS